MNSALSAIVPVAAALLTGCAASTNSQSASSAVSAPAEATQPDADIVSAGRYSFAGQLSKTQFESMRGTDQVVINCRTQREIDRLDFDQVAILEAGGVVYHHLPMGGADGYSPEAVDAFAAIVRSTDGPILIHCGSGTRARYLYAAYLIRYQNQTPDQAMAAIRELGQGPTSLERLLGERLSLQHTGEPVETQ